MTKLRCEVGLDCPAKFRRVKIGKRLMVAACSQLPSQHKECQMSDDNKMLEELRKREGWDKEDVIIVIHAERGMVPHIEAALNKLGLTNNALEITRKK